MRTDAREAVLKYLYAQSFNSQNGEGLWKSVCKNLSAEEAAFAGELYGKVDGNREHILAVIDQNIHHFKEDRLYPVDRAILMIAVAEILYFDDIPAAVSINEAVDLVQKYSTEKSADFVNGVLAGVNSSVRQSD